MAAIKTILVPTDFSPASDQALTYARQLADTFDASLHLLHVIENPFAPGAFMEMYTPPPGDYVGALEREARARLEGLLTEDDKARYGAVLAIRTGAAAHEILEYLQAHGDINLVVMATAGRGGVARLMMGSVTDRLVRSAPCPVLTLHPHETESRGTGHRAA
jgi:universal stress protein A